MIRMTTLRSQRSIAAIALAVVFAATLPAAASAQRPDDRPGLLGVGAAAVAHVAPARPDDRAGSFGVGAIATSSAQAVEPILVSRIADVPVRPDDVAAARGPGALSSLFQAAALTNAGSSFRWRDAAVGGAGTLGAVLLACALAISVRQRRRVVLP